MIIHRLGTKTNFVDANNVLVGYDLAQDCCEHARWWISTVPLSGENGHEDRDVDLSTYAFDPTWVTTARKISSSTEDDQGGRISFRLVSAIGEPELFLTLANAHNGYYCHGFWVEIGGKTIWGDVL